MKTRLSKQFSLNWQDAIRGLLVAVISAVITVIENSISIGDFNFNWENIYKVALTAGIGYIAKNLLFEPAKVITTAKSNNEAIEIEDVINNNV